MGADVVPVYHLGASHVLSITGNDVLSRKLRMSLGWVWGRWGLPLPRKCEIVSLVAPPIAGA